jgi:hypothetical protein
MIMLTKNKVEQNKAPKKIKKEKNNHQYTENVRAEGRKAS